MIARGIPGEEDGLELFTGAFLGNEGIEAAEDDNCNGLSVLCKNKTHVNKMLLTQGAHVSGTIQLVMGSSLETGYQFL